MRIFISLASRMRSWIEIQGKQPTTTDINPLKMSHLSSHSFVAKLLCLLLLLSGVFSLPPAKRRHYGCKFPFGGKNTKWVAAKRTSRMSSSHCNANSFRPFSFMSLLASNNGNNDLPEVTTWMTRKNFFVAIGTLLVSSSILLELYSRIGAFFISDDNDENLLPPLAQNQKHATIVFHGSGGQDQYTDALMQRLQKNKPSEYNEMVEWSKYSTNIFQASYNGERIGQLAVKELLANENFANLETVHVIGISVGSFCADAAVRELKKRVDTMNLSRQQRPFVQLTLLDPFTQRGIFGIGYGNKVFGTSTDYTQQFLNTDDPVPSTNAPLQNAVCYDITNLRPEDIFGHDWPVAYYGKSEDCGKVMTSSEQQSDRGVVVELCPKKTD